MDRATFSQGLAILRAAYPQSRADLKAKETIEVWFAVLGDLDGEKFLSGIKRIVQTQKFMPAISEIREAVLGNSANNLEAKALTAWNKVLHAIRFAGYVRSVKFDDPVIHHAIQIQGGWVQLCSIPNETELKFYRISWLKAYQNFYRTQQEGGLPEIPYLAGQTEIENQVKFPERVKPPVEITDQTINDHAQALALQHQQRSRQNAIAAPNKKLTPSAKAKTMMKSLLDGLTGKMEAV